VGRASPTRARWKMISKRSSQTRARNDYKRDNNEATENNFLSPDLSGACPFIAGSRSDLTWRERHTVNNRSDRSAWDRLASERLARSVLASDQRGSGRSAWPNRPSLPGTRPECALGAAARWRVRPAQPDHPAGPAKVGSWRSDDLLSRPRFGVSPLLFFLSFASY
jgi:hypothetical protein